VGQFARRIPFLQALFPSSGADVSTPNELTDVVHLVHPWPGRTLGLLSANVVQVGPSTPALTPALVALTTLESEWVELLYGDISHDSAAATNVQARLRKTGTGMSTFIARWTVMDTALSTLGGFEPLFGQPAGAFGAGKTVNRMPWPLIIPPLFELIFDGQTQAANYSLTFSGVVVRHPIHEPAVGL